MKKEVSPAIIVVVILVLLTTIQVVYWRYLVGGPKTQVRGIPKSGGGAAAGGEPVTYTGPEVTTFAGGPQPGYGDGPSDKALFNGPAGIAVDARGVMYIADSRNHCIRKISADGMVTTFAGTNAEGYADGAGARARFSAPAGIAVAPDGSLLVSDTGNQRVRKITVGGAVSTFAGSDTPRDDLGRLAGGLRDGAAAQAQFRFPSGLAVDGEGAVFVADAGNHCVRRITASGQVTTLATEGGKMDSPTEVALAGDRLWVADTGKGALWAGPREGPLRVWLPATGVKPPKAPSGIAAVGAALYVADSADSCVFRLAGDKLKCIVGARGAAGYADGRGAGAGFALPAGLASGPGGKLYVADFGNNCIRLVKP